MSRTIRRTQARMANSLREAIALGKLEPGLGERLRASLVELFHAEAVDDREARCKALNQLCNAILKSAP